MAEDEEYRHHPPGYDPRGPDFDNPDEDRRMAIHDAEAPCPVCGEVHKPHAHDDE